MYPLQLLYGAEWGEGAREKGVFPIALCTPAHLCQNASLLAAGLLSPNKTGVKAFARQNKCGFLFLLFSQQRKAHRSAECYQRDWWPLMALPNLTLIAGMAALGMDSLEFGTTSGLVHN